MLEKVKLETLMKAALSPPRRTGPTNGLNEYIREHSQGVDSRELAKTKLVEAAQSFKNLTPAEIEVS